MVRTDDEGMVTESSQTGARPRSKGMLKLSDGRLVERPTRKIEIGSLGPIKILIQVPANVKYTDAQIQAMKDRFAEKSGDFLENPDVANLTFPKSRGVIHEIVAKNIRRLRSEQGISQKDLAAKSGIPPQDMCRIEQARRLPRGPLLERIASALGTDAAALIRDVSDEAVPSKDKKGD